MLPRTILCLAAVLCLANVVSSAATINWINAVNGDWNTAGNWNPPIVPGPGDTAIIAIPGATVTLSSGTSVGGIVLGANGSGTVGLSLGMAGLSLNNQMLALNGPLTVNPGGSFTVDSGSLIGVTNALLIGSLGWTAGSLGGTLTIATNSVLTIAGGGGNDDLPGANVINYGTVAWTSGQLRGGGSPGTFVFNYGVWVARGDQVFNNDFGGIGTTFNNLGTFRKELSTGTTAFTSGVSFVNSGTIDAQDGPIAFQGPFTLAYGTTLNFGLGGPSGNGAIALSGPAAFFASLSVNFHGGFTPIVGTTFNLLNYTAESGTLFTRMVAPPSFAWRPNYGPTTFSLTTDYFFQVSPDETSVTLAWPAGWQLQTQTNSTQVGLSTNWFTVPGSTTTNQMVLPIDKTLGSVFFRMANP